MYFCYTLRSWPYLLRIAAASTRPSPTTHAALRVAQVTFTSRQRHKKNSSMSGTVPANHAALPPGSAGSQQQFRPSFSPPRHWLLKDPGREKSPAGIHAVSQLQASPLGTVQTQQQQQQQQQQSQHSHPRQVQKQRHYPFKQEQQQQPQAQHQPDLLYLQQQRYQLQQGQQPSLHRYRSILLLPHHVAGHIPFPQNQQAKAPQSQHQQPSYGYAQHPQSQSPGRFHQNVSIPTKPSNSNSVAGLYALQAAARKAAADAAQAAPAPAVASTAGHTRKRSASESGSKLLSLDQVMPPTSRRKSENSSETELFVVKNSAGAGAVAYEPQGRNTPPSRSKKKRQKLFRLSKWQRIPELRGHMATALRRLHLSNPAYRFRRPHKDEKWEDFAHSPRLQDMDEIAGASKPKVPPRTLRNHFKTSLGFKMSAEAGVEIWRFEGYGEALAKRISVEQLGLDYIDSATVKVEAMPHHDICAKEQEELLPVQQAQESRKEQNNLEGQPVEPHIKLQQQASLPLKS